MTENNIQHLEIEDSEKFINEIKSDISNQLWKQTKFLCIIQACYVAVIIANAIAQIIKLFAK